MAKKHHVAIDDATMSVLQRSEITETAVKLPTGQLDRKLYEKVNKTLAAAGGKWSRSAQAHVFTSDPLEALGMALAAGEIKDHKKASQAFYTPPSLAARVVMLASVHGKTVLEPSAGLGALADACRTSGAADITCIESDANSAATLRAKDHVILHADFLDQPQQATFDRVVMNPPFENGKDVMHVTHALGFLKPGGRLVAIMSISWLSRDDRRRTTFRALVESMSGTVEDIEAGAFKESGTNIVTVLLTIDKPCAEPNARHPKVRCGDCQSVQSAKRGER